MHWREASEQLAAIHAQVLRSELTLAFRAAPTAATGALALALAGWQLWVAPPRDASELTWQWIAVAVVSFLLCGLDLLLRVPRASRDERRRFALALFQLAPALVVAVALTAEQMSRGALIGLPALWCALFGLALVAARPYLPRSMTKVALFYLAGSGAMLLAVGDGLAAQAFGMGAIFGIGQIASAACLRQCVESRRAASRQELAR